jgi:hypothetical protein
MEHILRGKKMKRHRSNTPRPSARSAAAERPGPSRMTSFGVFTGTTLAALLTTLPINVTMTLGSSEPGPAVVGQTDVPNPICQATLTLSRTSSGNTPIQRAMS